jgi:chemotaxis protein methyltransferase CheR
MKETTFNQIRELVYERSGISLGDNKQALVRARIAKRMRHLNISDYSAYLHYVIEDNSGEEIQHMLDAISTNVTSFYREPAHFDFMQEVIGQWMGRGAKSLRFWSAACSTGEEPYTIAIEIREAIGSRNIDARILATDISSRVLEISMLGQYSEDKIKPVPKVLRDRYFTRYKDGGKNIYAVRDSIKEMVVFRQFNLSAAPYPIKKPLDMIFCRNVMIYFDREVRTSLANEFYRLLKPGGYLMVGHAESITGLRGGFQCIKPSIYLKE